MRQFFLMFYCLVSLAVASSLDTLKQGDNLNSSSQLVSPNKNFTLGFVTMPDSNDSYLGIWYTAGSYGHPVWLGNRDKPIHNNSGVLTLDNTGKLIIANNLGSLVVLYKGQTGTNFSASLLDSGNFVVREVKSDGSMGEELWQSFDYPTDTLIPGMKLGVNHRTGRNWSLTSWIGNNLPAPGAFTLEWDTVGHRLIVRRRGVIYWTSGVLKDKAFENIVPSPDPSNLNYNFTNVTKKEEDYFSYSLIRDPLFTPDTRKFISSWVLDYHGIIYDNDRPSIARVDLCYGYNRWGNKVYRGCELWEQPKCRNNHQTFDLRSGGFVGSGNVYSDDNSSLSFSDCKDNCYINCDCVGFWNNGNTGCTYWRGKNVRFNQDLSGSAVKINVLVSAPSNKNSKKRIILIVTTSTIAFIVLLLVLFCYLKKIRKREEDLLELMSLKGSTDNKEHENDGGNGPGLKMFTYASIMAATNCFSSANKLGEGGFGPVYKGKLPEGQEVAVKRLSRRSGQGFSEFRNEVKLIAKLQHTNLVRLFGCCIHRDEKLLIYEYMPNRSLDFFLFDATKRSLLTWEKRVNIIEGIAQGLLYIHKYSRLKIVHRDLKPSNILLDENMNPKISDFGMARIFTPNISEENTNRAAGTFGYMAPEYAMEGIFSVKSDVFSFGVMLLELVSGRKNNSFHSLDGPLSLVEHAWELWNKGAAMELVDPVLVDSRLVNQFLRCIHVALLCVENRALDRPTMDEIVSMLTNDSVTLTIPKKPGFVTRSSVINLEDVKETKLRNDTVNGLSISELEAR